jgi:hypothetical protein
VANSRKSRHHHQQVGPQNRLAIAGIAAAAEANKIVDELAAFDEQLKTRLRGPNATLDDAVIRARLTDTCDAAVAESARLKASAPLVAARGMPVMLEQLRALRDEVANYMKGVS